MSDHWNSHAQQWQWIASPLRPAADDILVAESALRAWHSHGRKNAINVALLGVTPEIAGLEWPATANLVAIDHTEAMIRALWSSASGRSHAVCADWRKLPIAAGSQDVVIGDGCFSVFESGEHYPVLVREARRVLRKDGVMLMRFFVRPEIAEPPARVLADLKCGAIGNFHAFKWRLAMALHGSLDEGVKLADVWDAWHAACPDAGALATVLNWRIEEVRTIDAYRGARGRYTFPTLREVRHFLGEHFSEVSCTFPPYELGERCPTLVLQPR